MLTKLLHPLTLGFGLLPAAATAQIFISGQGTISVVVGDSFATADPANATVGCLNAAGKLTLADCATYTGGNNNRVATGEGVCSFHNTSAPASPSYWDDYAFTCWEHEDNNRDTQFWTLAGFPYEWMCQGDLRCYYDLASIPSSSDDEIDFWYYVGNPAEGHSLALLLWEPVS